MDQLEAGVREAFKAAGTRAKLAAALSEIGDRITPQGVGKWRVVPPKRVLDVERVTGIPRSKLRPDLYPD